MTLACMRMRPVPVRSMAMGAVTRSSVPAPYVDMAHRGHDNDADQAAG